jgi:hypothetical protein
MGRPAAEGRRAIPPPPRATAIVALVVLAACSFGPGPTPTPGHDAHDPQAERVIAALGAELEMTFEPAGPHHRLGRAPDGSELDLIGVPVEQVILSVPADDTAAGLPYLAHIRDLLHGPDRVYDWVAAMLACRSDAARSCEESLAQGNLEARFSDGGPDYVVVTLARGL